MKGILIQGFNIKQRPAKKQDTITNCEGSVTYKHLKLMKTKNKKNKQTNKRYFGVYLLEVNAKRMKLTVLMTVNRSVWLDLLYTIQSAEWRNCCRSFRELVNVMCFVVICNNRRNVQWMAVVICNKIAMNCSTGVVTLLYSCGEICNKRRAVEIAR